MKQRMTKDQMLQEVKMTVVVFVGCVLVVASIVNIVYILNPAPRQIASINVK